MRFLPRTLFGQILAALLVGLVAVQAVGLWLVLDDRARMAERLLGAYAAQRLGGVITILNQAEPTDRQRLVAALNVPPTHLALGEEWGNPSAEAAVFGTTFGKMLSREPWQSPSDDEAQDANAFVDRLTQELSQPIPVRILSIKLWEPRRGSQPVAPAQEARSSSSETSAPPAPRLNRPLLSVIGQAKLTDGSVLTFRHSLPREDLDWPLRLLVLLVLLVVSIALLSVWTVRRLTRPLSTLADAASGLAHNLEQPPLPENGPLEISRAAIAFNTMQREIKRYLDTRARALAGVSHDLRLPITRIRLRIDRLADETLRAQIDGDLAEMDTMIGNTLEFLRAGTGGEKKVRLDLDALLEGLAEDMEILGVTVSIHGTVGQPYLGRPTALRRGIGNLLDNARRYGGGSIGIEVSSDSANVLIEITDQGLGIPESELETVCEPYVRLESSRARHTGGTGLGLTIARDIARSHGGDLKLARRPGGGLIVRLTLAWEKS